MSTEEDTNPYELLKLESSATEAEIKSAYRKISLKVHPDRNPNNPEAARLFHELNQAYELLLDPLRRLALDQKLRVKLARKERYKTFDAKRKVMVEELEQRERAAVKRAKMNGEEEVRTRNETERIKEEGRRLREEKEARMNQVGEERVKERVGETADELDVPPELSPLDTTIRLKWSLKTHPELTSPEAIAALLSSFGSVDTESIVLSLKTPKKSTSSSTSNKPKSGTALVPFKQIGDAYDAVCESGKTERGLDGIEIGWVSGKEPEILAWLKKMGKLGVPKHKPKDDAFSGADSRFSTFPSTFPDVTTTSIPSLDAPGGLDFESMTLLRMRQAERERLEREIREQEAAES